MVSNNGIDMIIEGDVLDDEKDKIPIYLALFKKDNYWSVAGIIYHSPEEAKANLAIIRYDKILLVRCFIQNDSEK